MDFYGWKPYVPVAQRRRAAMREVDKRRRQGQGIAPVSIEGRTIASTFWGKSWCKNLESYSDYANRLPRGRSYVRNGSVLDLQIRPGAIDALVSGTSVYEVSLTIAPVAKAQWKSICCDCAGGVDSLVELLQGRLSKAVMERICRQNQGLFPSPKEIRLSCSCPDSAYMCKHVAAVLYGIGARLDQQPELLFRLRGVDESELIASAGESMPVATKAVAPAKVLGGEDLGALFGLDMAQPAEPGDSRPKRVRTASAKKAARKKPAKRGSPGKARPPAAKQSKVPRSAGTKR